jgi:nucleoside-diphosphate-sugar epimerase
VNRTKSVKRVVLTSSIMAIYGDSQDSQQAPHGKFDESYWNSSSSLSYQPYPYSKVMAEREAWRIHDAPDNHGWSMVALNPALILGPSLTPHTRSGSIPVLTTLASIRARLGVPNVVAPLVDVRDVARAHLLAGDNSAASGRNILVAESVTLLQIAAHLRAGFPEHGFPSRELPKWLAWLIGPMAGLERRFVSRNVGYPVTLDNARSRRELGMSYRPLAHTLCEHFQQLIDDGLVEAKPARQGASAAAPVDNRASN